MSDHKNDSLGNRMKTYEDAYRINLPIRMPVILRIDGKAFHTYTEDCKRPVDQGLVNCMNDTAIALCGEVQGCQLAYVQSDEISLLVTNYQTNDTQPWFENNIQKMVSVAASVAGVTFTMNSWKIWGNEIRESEDGDIITIPQNEEAYFDARAWILPKEEVCNYFLWRQQDATRNSVQMLARSLYSHKQLDKKDSSELQELIFKKGINWNDCPTPQKRGRCIIKKKVLGQAWNPKQQKAVEVERSIWAVDNDIPVFSTDRKYVERFVYPEKQ